MRTIQGVEVLDTLCELADPRHSALIVVDMQNDFCHPDGHFPKNGKDVSAITDSVPALVSFVKAAQERGVMVVFVRQQTLPNGLSDSPAWLRFKCRDGKSPEYTLKDSWGAQLVDGLVPGPGDVVVDKFRPDAFFRTPLDGILRARGMQSLIVVGNSTEGCVESTIRGGSYHDYYIVAVMDLISSTNATLHAGSQQLVRARYPHASAADVVAAWDEALAQRPVAT
jgi:ureidoacrylate peracid hydrolase